MRWMKASDRDTVLGNKSSERQRSARNPPLRRRSVVIGRPYDVGFKVFSDGKENWYGYYGGLK